MLFPYMGAFERNYSGNYSGTTWELHLFGRELLLLGAVPLSVPENTRQILERRAEKEDELPNIAGMQGKGTTELQEEEHIRN